MSRRHQATGEPQASTYQLLTSNAEATDAIERVVIAAQRELRIFDATPRTLRDRGFGTQARIVTLQNLLLASRGHRLRIALHDTTAIETELPRLIELLRRFSGQTLIHRTLGAATNARDPMIIADERHFWRKMHVDQSRSVITLDDPVETGRFLERFEEIWGQSELAVSGNTLGL